MGSSANTHAPIAARLGYNGEHHEPTGAWQSLGNGHRIYNPVLMRFHSADQESPFSRGGINTYCYCGAEPVNRTDPSGRAWKMMVFAAMFTGGAAALGAAAVAVSAKNDTQRLLAILGGVSAVIAISLGGRYAFKKHAKKPQPAPQAPQPAARTVKVRDAETQTDIKMVADVPTTLHEPSAPPLSPTSTTPPLSRQGTPEPRRRLSSVGSEASHTLGYSGRSMATAARTPQAMSVPISGRAAMSPQNTAGNIRRQSVSEALVAPYRRYSEYQFYVS
ncbi:RHS repeat-associated core domain-containing protein [Stenotrophomonas sp.]|uniref:RHS repeat-associated core domain-containing protein n=1 Tax=Stenotrophomonas sp. TaxID=69392 RepID=UPI0028AB0E48|nr:RHS repeat-associated core domain-containing protein [Stenotrophomonas sp.]